MAGPFCPFAVRRDEWSDQMVVPQRSPKQAAGDRSAACLESVTCLHEQKEIGLSGCRRSCAAQVVAAGFGCLEQEPAERESDALRGTSLRHCRSICVIVALSGPGGSFPERRRQ